MKTQKVTFLQNLKLPLVMSAAALSPHRHRKSAVCAAQARHALKRCYQENCSQSERDHSVSSSLKDFKIKVTSLMCEVLRFH